MSKAATLKDLKISGLTASDFKALKIEVITPAQNLKLTGKGNDVPGYVIPYFDIHGKPIKKGWRRRNLKVPLFMGKEPEKPRRYTGPKGELPHLFFPQNFAGWLPVSKDNDETIYITEGEKKAAALCKAGLPCIAVPGVWGWRSKDRGIDLLNDFDCIDFKGRDVVLIFDNDILTNENVIHALNAFSNKLSMSKGAQVFIKPLPPGKEKGLDDFIVAFGIDAFLALPDEPFTQKKAVFKLNERLAFIDGQSFVYDLKTKRNYNTTAKLEFQFAHLTHFELVDGELKAKKTIKEWHNSNAKRMYKDICYAPGKDEDHDSNLNIWPGWGCEPKKGNVKPFIDLVDFIFKNAEPGVKEWFLCWLAFPLQNPGVKMFSAVLLWSQATGIGKSLLGLILKRIYGDNFSEVTKEQLTSAFNPWRIGKQFILGDEITGSDSKKEADLLKGIITAEDFQANLKNQGQYPLRACENYFLTSNHENALHLSPEDRRYLVHHISGEAMPNGWYDIIDDWKRSKAGPPALFHYLLNEIDCSNFKPFAGPPVTQAKRAMFEASKTWVEVALEDIIENPEDHFAKLGVQRDVFTPTELLAFLGDNKNVNAAYLGRMCQRAALPYKIARIKLPRPGSRKLYAVRNVAKWHAATPQQWADNYELDFKPDKYKKGKV